MEPFVKGDEKETAPASGAVFDVILLFAVTVVFVIAVTLEDHNLLVVSVPVVVSIHIVIVMPVLLYNYRFLSVCRSDWQRQRYDAKANDSQNEIAHFISSMVARCSTQTNSKPFHEQSFIATDFEGTECPVSNKSGRQVLRPAFR
jgi:hypothetical protein